MLILDKPRSFNGREIVVPLYHRGHLSMFPQTTIWMCFLPSVAQASSADKLAELVISPIDFDSWAHLWRITITVTERTGVVHDIFQTLRELGLNILASESSSMEQQNRHFIEIIADAKHYNDPIISKSGSGYNVDHPDLPYVKTAILARILKDVNFFASGEPRIRLTRMMNLHNATELFRDSNDFLGSVQPVYDSVLPQVVDGREQKLLSIGIPSVIQKKLKNVLSRDQEYSESNQGRYLLVSDSRDRFLRAYFIKPSDPVIYAKVTYKEKVGALAAITYQLKEKRFSILTSLSRLYHHGQQASFEFVATRANASRKNLRQLLDGALSTHELRSNYDVQILFPKTTSSPINLPEGDDDCAPGSETDAVVAQESSAAPDAYEECTAERMIERIQAGLKDITGNKDIEIEDERKGHALSLGRQMIRRLNQTMCNRAPEYKVFISYHFKDIKILKMVCDYLREMNYEPIYTKDPPNKGINEAIIQDIETSDFFLGIWTEADAYTMTAEGEKRFWPSSWLMYEWGIARACGLRYKLLLSKNMDRNCCQRIDSNNAHPDVDFSDRKQLRDVIKQIRPTTNDHSIETRGQQRKRVRNALMNLYDHTGYEVMTTDFADEVEAIRNYFQPNPMPRSHN